MKDESFVITPKGWLMVALMPEISPDKFEQVWSDLQAFVKSDAESNGATGEVPVLVFDGGGYCTMATPKNK